MLTEFRWFGHVQRRDKYDATINILQMTVDGTRNRGRPKLRWRDVMKEDMTRNQMITQLRRIICKYVFQCVNIRIGVDWPPLQANHCATGSNIIRKQLAHMYLCMHFVFVRWRETLLPTSVIIMKTT